MRNLLWFALGFGAACAVGAYFYSNWLIVVGVMALATAVAVLLLYRDRPVLKRAGITVLGLALGFGWFAGYYHLYLGTAAGLDGQECTLTAIASDYSYSTDYGTAVEAKIHINSKSYKTVVYLRQSASVSPGDAISGSFRMRMTHGGAEDETYHRSEGTFLLAYAMDECQLRQTERLELQYYPAMLRKQILQKIDTSFPGDTAAFAKALLLGDRTDIDYETNTAFKVTGISHIIAVSGLHISILFSLIGTMVGRRRVLVAILGIPMLLLFAAVVGFTPSITRACIMQILMIIATLLDRDYDAPIALSFACLIMLALNPIVITSVSFQLSVSCMAGIFLFSEPIRQWIIGLYFWADWKGMPPEKRLRNWFASTVSVTISSMTFTTPLVIWYFGTVSLVSILTNLLTLWVVNWIFYGILLVCVLAFIWTPAATVAAWLLSWLIRYVLGAAKLIARFPMAAVYTKSVYIIFWVVLCYILVAAYLVLRRKKPEITVCCGIVGLCMALILSWAQPLVNECTVTVLDVGQGQSILLQAGGRNFLVDCGGDRDSEAADAAAETLLSMGISRLDGVVLTHYDRDHAGGLMNLLTRIRADAVYIPRETDDMAMQRDILKQCENPVYVDVDTDLTWDSGQMTIYAPYSGTTDNERGLCVLFREGNCDILITGDLNTTSENRLLLQKRIPELTVLIAGHHGSKYSTGEGLLSSTKPEYVMISVGEDNPYGHPSEEVLERVRAMGCELLRTDMDGTIVFRR